MSDDTVKRKPLDDAGLQAAAELDTREQVDLNLDALRAAKKETDDAGLQAAAELDTREQVDLNLDALRAAKKEADDRQRTATEPETEPVESVVIETSVASEATEINPIDAYLAADSLPSQENAVEQDVDPKLVPTMDSIENDNLPEVLEDTLEDHEPEPTPRPRSRPRSPDRVAALRAAAEEERQSIAGLAGELTEDLDQTGDKVERQIDDGVREAEQALEAFAQNAAEEMDRALERVDPDLSVENFAHAADLNISQISQVADQLGDEIHRATADARTQIDEAVQACLDDFRQLTDQAQGNLRDLCDQLEQRIADQYTELDDRLADEPFDE